VKLGIVADEISRDFATAVAIGEQAGLHRYEIRNLKSGRIPLCDPAELDEVDRICAEQDVEITAISPGLFKLVDDEAGFVHAMSEVYPLAAKWAHRWRLPGLIVFGFLKPTMAARVVEWFAKAAQRAATDGLTLMIEPEPICFVDTSQTAASVIEQTGATNLRINYDPGNVAWFWNRDPIEEFASATKWIANVHVKDIRVCDPPEFVPAGEGMIDYRAHFAALRDSGYVGPVSLEPHMDGSLETIVRCKEAIMRCL
jgi:L-ribulose-5-phosphate 3-epimerase